MARESHAECLQRRIPELEHVLANFKAELPRAIKEEREQAEADAKAAAILRASGPHGARLADGEVALVPSCLFRNLLYAISADPQDRIQVCFEPLGRIGGICIEARSKAPNADVLLSKLRLAEAHEKLLWTTGNFESGLVDFLPRQIREWREEASRARRSEPQAEAPEPAEVCEETTPNW